MNKTYSDLSICNVFQHFTPKTYPLDPLSTHGNAKYPQFHEIYSYHNSCYSHVTLNSYNTVQLSIKE